MAEDKTIQIISVLKDISDENHPVTQKQILEALKDTGCATTENAATLSNCIDDILRQINPLEYSPEVDCDYKIKYCGYKDNILDIKELKNELKKLKRRQGADKQTISERLSQMPSKVPPITDIRFVHLFSTEEMDQLIHAIVFLDTVSSKTKVKLIKKIISTASRYYENPLFDRKKNKLKFDSHGIFGRKSTLRAVSDDGMGDVDIGRNVIQIQSAINDGVQIKFRYSRYNSEKILVPNEKTYRISPFHIVVYHDMYFLLGKTDDKENYLHFRIDLMSDIEVSTDENGKPLKRVCSVRIEHWDPIKYMSEHLYMGYDTPQSITIKIPQDKYTVLHNWFGNNFRKLKKPCCEGYDYVEVTTSPSLIVQWAMQYSDIVEIMDEDIREKIRESLKKTAEKYSK